MNCYTKISYYLNYDHKNFKNPYEKQTYFLIHVEKIDINMCTDYMHFIYNLCIFTVLYIYKQ